MADQDVVIVGADGTEHIFPPGFDPQQAAAIVKAQPAAQGWGSSLKSIASPAGVEGLKQYGSDLLTGNGSARSDVADYAKKEGGAFLSTLNPVNQIKGVLRLATTNPATSVSNLYQTGKSALEGDPEAVGSVLGMAVAPKADAAVLRGVNTTASTIANSPKLQGTAGYIGGAGVGIAGGGHPFIMGRIGQAAAPAIGAAAGGVEKMTGSVMDAFRMDRAGGLPKEFDRYAPNSSGYDPREPAVMSDTPDLPRGIAQGVYTQLPDGSWGVRALPGHQLVQGEPVNVMSRAGEPKVIHVGRVGPDGIAALEGGGNTAAEPISIGGSRVTDPKVLELIRQRLGGQ